MVKVTSCKGIRPGQLLVLARNSNIGNQYIFKNTIFEASHTTVICVILNSSISLNFEVCKDNPRLRNAYHNERIAFEYKPTT